MGLSTTEAEPGLPTAASVSPAELVFADVPSRLLAYAIDGLILTIGEQALRDACVWAKKLTPDMQPLWGSMTPQHMVEHLAWVIDGAMGRWKAIIVTPEEKILKVRPFVYTNYAIRPGTSWFGIGPGAE